LHTSEESLEKAIRGQGSYYSLSYLFGTRSFKRAIDGFASGNVTKLKMQVSFKGILLGKKII
jgi:hypothetical protein